MKNNITRELLLVNILKDENFHFLTNFMSDKVMVLRKYGELKNMGDFLANNSSEIQTIENENIQEIIKDFI